MEIGADFVALAFAKVVTLRAACLGFVLVVFWRWVFHRCTLKRFAPFLSSPIEKCRQCKLNGRSKSGARIDKARVLKGKWIRSPRKFERLVVF